MNTSDLSFDQPDDHDPDLATRFASATRPTSMAAVESDLDAVHQRARHVQRRRIIGGTAAAGLLVVGGGVLAINDRGEEPTVAVSASAGVDGDETGVAPDDADDDSMPAPTDDGIEGDAGASSTDESTTPPFDLSELDGMFGDFPIPELPPFPEPGADGTVDWSAYVEELGRSLEAWVDELQTWLSDNPDVTTWFDLNGPFGEIGGPLGELDIDTWLQDFDLEEWKQQLDELDFDTWFEDFDIEQWNTEFGADGFDLDGWLDGLDLDQWREHFESGDFDIDQWLSDLGARGGEGSFPFPIPDLGDLENLDLENLDELDLGEFGPFDLENLDLDQLLGDVTAGEGFDLENLDLDQLFQDFGAGDGQLPDLSELESVFEDLFGQIGTEGASGSD